LGVGEERRARGDRKRTKSLGSNVTTTEIAYLCGSLFSAGCKILCTCMVKEIEEKGNRKKTREKRRKVLKQGSMNQRRMPRKRKLND
jgi:hypothetical protein